MDTPTAIPDARALSVLRARVESAFNDAGPETAFGAFLSRFRAKADQGVRFGVAWTDLPLVEIVLFGLWPMVESLAERRGTALTEEALVDDLAPRLHRLVEAGLLLSYASADEAAEAFRAEVLEPFMGELGRLPPGTAKSLHELVVERSFAFFADRVTVAKKFGERLEAVDRRLPSSIADSHEGLPVLDAWHATPSIVQYFRVLDGDAVFPSPGHGIRPFSWEAAVSAFRDGHASLLRQWRRFAALSRLPYRNDRLPADLSVGGTDLAGQSVEAAWLLTQAILAAVGHEETDRVPEEHAHAWFTVANALSHDERRDKLFARLEKKGWRPDATDREMVEETFRTQFAFWANAVAGRPSAAAGHLLTSLDVARMPITKDIVESYMTRPDRSLDDVGGAVSNARAREMLDALDWKSLTVERLEEMVTLHRVPLAGIVRCLSRLPSAQQKKAASLVETTALDLTDIGGYSALMRHGYVPHRFDDLHYRFQMLNARTIVWWLTKHAVMEFAGVPGRWAYIVTRLQKRSGARRHFRRFASDPGVRAFVLEQTNEDLFHASGGVDPACETSFRRLFGRVLWRRFVFACELRARWRDFQDLEALKAFQRTGDATDLRPWRGLGDGEVHGGFAYLDLPRLLDVDSAELPRLLRIYTEERVFRWLYANEPDLDARWRAYVRARDAYFRWADTEGPFAKKAPRTKKPKAKSRRR